MDINPFDLDDNETYLRWRESKLKDYPTKFDNLLVEVNNPRKLRQREFDALQQRCRKANMAVYVGKTGDDPDQEIPFAIARQFGVSGLNKNWLADENALSSLMVRENGVRQHYIPYTNQAINWHTDGYYNSPEKQIRSMMLHSVQKAGNGGENSFFDHEIVYILLREADPEHIRILMRPDALSIPPRLGEYGEVARKTETGPVFSLSAAGDLHMRYTIRKKNVVWADNPETKSAVKLLNQILTGDSDFVFQILLEPGMGLISNNVLHNRNAFVDNENYSRHFFRSRYFERLRGTGVSEVYFSL